MNLINEYCIGCGACENICPQKCIKIKKNNDGFSMAYCNKKKCINCNLCHKICENNILKLNKNKCIYAVKNKNEIIRKKSSSGGFFLELSKHWIKKGFVVGALFNEKFEVEHSIVNDIKDLEKLSGAKYVQSNLKNIFSKIKELLSKDKYILFSGTPCQCNALKCYLDYFKVETKKLLLCDVICHGVPSPLNLKKYIKYQENLNKDCIKDITFRNKDDESIQNMKIIFNNKEYISKPRKDIYYYSFFKGYNFMKNCYQCKYTSFDRCGDISLGDFWGCDIFYPDFYDKKGISLVFINTKKGLKVFNEINNNFNYIKVNKDTCIQPSLVEAIKEPEDNIKFKMLLKNNYEKVAKFIGEKNEKSKV